MFHKIKNVYPLPDHRLSVQFAEGCTKIYDVKPLFKQIPTFEELKDSHLFSDVTVDVGGHGIVSQGGAIAPNPSYCDRSRSLLFCFS